MLPSSPAKQDQQHLAGIVLGRPSMTTPGSVSPSGSIAMQNTLSNMHPYNPSTQSSARYGGVVTPRGMFGDVPLDASQGFDTGRSFLFGPVGRKMARNVYNMVGFLVGELKMHSLVISTAMKYYHFVALKIGVSGVHEVNEIVLACACVLLASKVEHSRVRMVKLVVACFAIDAPDTSAEANETYQQYRRMVLEAEMVVCSLLEFEFHRQSPYPRLEAVLMSPASTPAPSAATATTPLPATTTASSSTSNGGAIEGGAGNSGYAGLYMQCRSLYSILLVSPMIESCAASALADAIVNIAARHLQFEDESLYERLTEAPPKLTAEVESELLEILAQQSTRTQIEQLNTRVKQIKMQRAAEKTAGAKRSRSTDR